MTIPHSNSSLEIYLLGAVDFGEVQQLQRRLVYEHGERGGATLLLCEHPPTLSVGRTGSRAHVALDDAGLAGMGIRTHWVNRGGGCVLHVPGQLSGYFVTPLDPAAVPAMRHVERLQEALLAVLEEFELRGEARYFPHGIFLGAARVASIGVAVSRGIAYHGFTLNVGPYLDLFDVLVEPGFAGSPLRQTSMESRRQRPTLMSKVREALVRQIERVFELDRHHLYTHHPRLRRKVLTHAYAPSPG
ncbi:lipoyl(octanoyl) transferase LipB [Planctomyces sp. SH-PL62]|uniref:lipoyl(octanoyl) transferase LipB n=1 Tax=Planctomyces sp. SH-PL62 TaxID=1636152 RepID=UPI00078C066C|nr:lipoate--protein ligase [Planctomyces sp. SH-PL62]AMV39665.1 Octanoyltransferase [Planctomyces sp. SH-PL62]